MIDSGATGNFISTSGINECKLKTTKKTIPIELSGFQGAGGRIDYETLPAELRIGNH